MTDAEDATHTGGDQPAPPQTPGPLADASVRTGRPNDAPAIGAVQAETFAAAYTDVLPAEALEQFHPDAFAKVWRDGISAPPSPAHRVLVACAGEQVVGFAALGPSSDADETLPAHSGELFLMCVHTAARRSGHGSRLLNASADTLKAANFTVMTCWALAEGQDFLAFAAESGLTTDGAWRDRVVSPDGATVREVRLVAHLDG
ncbi:MAG: GNAT family N-acetyltransferase [Ornithinimicrobium sp.]